MNVRELVEKLESMGYVDTAKVMIRVKGSPVFFEPIEVEGDQYPNFVWLVAEER